MTHYDDAIDEWIWLIRNNEIPHCKEQELLIDNIVIPTLNRRDILIDSDVIRRGLTLQKYFPYKLLPWEKFQFALLAGVFVKTKSGKRDNWFKKCLDIIGRGAGKNGFIDFLAFYLISPYNTDGVSGMIKGYNVDLIANGEDQAATSIVDVADVINDPVSPAFKRTLERQFKATKERVTNLQTGSVFRLNTTSTKNKDSKRTGAIVFDELHQYTDTTNMNTLRSGFGKVPLSREITITTDGHVRGGVLDRRKEQAERILSGYDPENRELINWFRIEDPDKWDDLDEIIKANPSLADPSFDSLRTQIELEIHDMPTTPDYFPEFMAKRCNFPMSDPARAIAQWKYIEACTADPPFEIRQGQACVGGVDYTKANDFAGCILLFRNGENYCIKHHTFICKRSTDLPYIHAPIDEWADAGTCTIVDDVEIPPGVIADWFAEQKLHYNILKIGVDDYRWSLLARSFEAIGYTAKGKAEEKTIYLTRRSDVMKAAPVILSLYPTHHLYGYDRMMCWYTNNAKQIIDASGNIQFGKQDPRLRKTDGFMAMVHAFCIRDALPEVQDMPDIRLGTFVF